MNLYRIRNTAVGGTAAWAGSQAEAASIRKTLVSAGAKRADIVTQTVDVPTNKAGLIEFLNRLEAGQVEGSDE